MPSIDPTPDGPYLVKNPARPLQPKGTHRRSYHDGAVSLRGIGKQAVL